jgi:hypothetical protein
MRIHGSLYQEATPELMARIQPKNRHDCGDCGPDRGAARKLAMNEVGRHLGLDFKSVTHALRTLLVKAGEGGGDAVPVVLDKVNQALEKAGVALREAGLSEEQVAATLKDVRDRLGASLAGAAEQATAQTTVYARKDKAKLDITTQEGDQVRIRFRTREGFAAQEGAATTDAPRNVYAVGAGRVEISVNGELNADELEAIGALVAKVESLANDFFAGDFDKAFAAAANLGFDGEQIAGFALRLSTRQLVRGQGAPGAEQPAAALQTPAVLPAVPKPAPKPIAAPVATAPKPAAPVATSTTTATPAPAPAPTSQPAPGTSQTSLSVTAGQPVNPLATTAPESLPAEVASPIAGFLSRVMDILGAMPQGGRFEFSMQWSLRLVIDAVAAAEPEEAPKPGPQLLQSTLEVIGQQLEPAPVSEPAPTATDDAAAAA